MTNYRPPNNSNGFWIAALLVWLFGVAVILTMVFVAVHFIIKFW